MDIRTITLADARAAQDELGELRSLEVHADHARWTARGAGAENLRTMVKQFESRWDEWAELVAGYLIDHDTPPDGRVSTLTGGRYRGWLAGGWREVSEMGEWIAHELDVLGDWTHTRSEAATDREVLGKLLADIEIGLGAQRSAYDQWFRDPTHGRSRGGATGAHPGRRFRPPLLWASAAAWAAGRKRPSAAAAHRRRTDHRRSRES